MTAVNRFLLKKVASREVIRDDHSVYSRQWLELSPSDSVGLTPEFLVENYLAFIRKCTFSIVQPLHDDGKTVFALFGSSFSLLTFSGPEFRRTKFQQSAALRIAGGVLVQRNECGKGLLSFNIEIGKDSVQVAVEVCDYCPLLLGGTRSSKLRKWFYRCTQALIHKIVTSRFLCHLQRHLQSGRAF